MGAAQNECEKLGDVVTLNFGMLLESAASLTQVGRKNLLWQDATLKIWFDLHLRLDCVTSS